MRTLTKTQTRLVNRPDLQPAARLFAKAASASRLHIETATDALQTYGSQGAQISGIVRDHFPEHIKTLLRESAHDVTQLNAQALALRPRSVRVSTMIHLAKVICKRDGTGFYGFCAAS